jgi:hypothetical protein
MAEINLEYQPQERQKLLHSTVARQILYGGAAGGGKSHSLRWDGIVFCLQNPGCQAYLFRRTMQELYDNHIRKITAELPATLGQYIANKNEFAFTNGSVLRFCYCEKEQDVARYQGAEMHWVGIDEASHLTPYQIHYLKTRNRLGSWKPAQDSLALPRFAMASNPGGPGHNYLKMTFLNHEPETIFPDSEMVDPEDPEDEGWPSIFIPAKMADNAYLDKGYAAAFGGLPPELARALREGDWDAVVGQALHNLRREDHQLRHFEPPRHWTRFMSIDWGTASPFSVGWFCVAEAATLKGKDGWPDRYIQAGAVIMYDELYGWNGKPNQGCRWDAAKVARAIVEREDERGDTMDYRVGDTEMWANRGGPGVAEWFERTDPRLVMQKSQKDRKRNYSEVISRLAGNPRFSEDGEVHDDPMFFATVDCTHFWRTCPPLVLDELDPEKGPETRNQEDHVYDQIAYGLRSRPYLTSEEDRYEIRWGAERDKALGRGGDPYAT